MDRPFVTIGRIIKSHGTNGEVSFKPEDGLPLSSLDELSVWIVPPYEHADPFRVAGVRPGPKGPLVKLQGIDSLEIASGLGGRSLVARAEDLPQGWAEEELSLEGYSVVDSKRGVLGTIEEVIITGANDVWVVRGEDYGEVLVPVIEDVVIDADHDTRRIDVELLPGLIDEEDE